MSDKDKQDDLIKNPQTRSRRDWVARAVQSVRRRLEAGEPLPEANEAGEAGTPPPPSLHVVPSSRKS